METGIGSSYCPLQIEGVAFMHVICTCFPISGSLWTKLAEVLWFLASLVVEVKFLHVFFALSNCAEWHRAVLARNKVYNACHCLTLKILKSLVANCHYCLLVTTRGTLSHDVAIV